MWAFIMFFVCLGIFLLTLVAYLIIKAVSKNKKNNKKKVK